MCYLLKKCQQSGRVEFHQKCRKCLECRQERAREWGLRNMMEQEEQGIGCFITLTYSEEHNPIVLIKKDLQDFKKRLRDHLRYHYNGIKIKTFDCGEYGDKNYRPHFHMLIQGFDFPKKYKERESNSGHLIYNCEELEKIWGKGLITIQDMTINSAAYCALYAAKPKEFLPEHLQEHPEFNTMSHSLGINKILENMETYLLTDEIFFDGKKYRIPQSALNKYFEKYLSARKLWGNRVATDMYPELSEKYFALKQRRIEKGEQIWQARALQMNMEQSYEQAKFRAENREKRLSKSL